MKHLILSIVLAVIPSAAFAADTLIIPGSTANPAAAKNAYYQDASNKLAPLMIVMTSDGAGNIIPVAGAGAPMSVTQGTTPWIVSASSLPLPSGAATEAKQDAGNASLTSLDSKLPAQVSGRVPVDGSGVTQPVSAASLPLPSGASTEAKQDVGNTSLSSIDGKLPAQISGRVPVDGSGVTQPVSLASIPLASDAATSTNQVTANASLSSIDSKLSAPLSVSNASRPVLQLADTPILDASVTQINGSAGALVQVVASLSSNIKKMRVADLTGAFIGVYEGANLKFVINPGMDAEIDVNMNSGSSVSVRSMETANITSGKVLLQFM